MADAIQPGTPQTPPVTPYAPATPPTPAATTGNTPTRTLSEDRLLSPTAPQTPTSGGSLGTGVDVADSSNNDPARSDLNSLMQQSSTTPADTAGATATAPVTTTDGTYSTEQCVADMRKIKASEYGGDTTSAGVIPDEASLKTLASAIITNSAAISGKTLVGDFTGVSKKEICQGLVAMAYKESRFGVAGRDPGGVFQAFGTRVAEYNAANGTSYTQNSLAGEPVLATKVATWCMANPVGLKDASFPGGLKPEASVAPPSSALDRMAYFWNYNPNELADYMTTYKKFTTLLRT